MTKKDYELFAWAIYNNRPGADGDDLDLTWERMIAIVSECFKIDNPSFQADKFERACYEGKHIRKSIKNET